MREKRKYNRMPLEELSARIVEKENHAELDYFPINVSEDGISIFTNKTLPIGTIYLIELGLEQIELKVVWSRPKEDDPAIFRVGLQRTDSEHNLDQLIQDELSY